MAESFKYVLIILYVGVTYALSYIGLRKARSLAGFSIGNKDMSPYLVGITMAASIASSATFVINPGFVYTHGLSAYLHFGVAAFLGITVALVALCKGFRRFGDASTALTIPHWIYNRYQSRGLSLFFAILNLFTIAFVVLILVACAFLCGSLFGISQKLALTLVLLFVFSYVLMGGVYAHAYTNAVQGVMMLVISIFLVGTGFAAIEGGFFENLQAVSADYAAIYNPSSDLYYDFFSVFGSSFLITFALMMQPHILTKTLYLKSDRDVDRFLVTSLVVGFVFSLVLMVGFFARFQGLDVPQDQVTATYINVTFDGSLMGKFIQAFITVALLAAGMSTLDGILVALSAMVVNDIYMPLSGGNIGEKKGLDASRFVLAAVGLVAFALAWNPPKLVGLFAQKGVYALAAASFVPITLGVLSQRKIPAWIMGTTSFIAVTGHLILNQWFFTNPSVSASYAIMASVLVSILLLAPSWNKAGNPQLESLTAND